MTYEVYFRQPGQTWERWRDGLRSSGIFTTRARAEDKARQLTEKHNLNKADTLILEVKSEMYAAYC